MVKKLSMAAALIHEDAQARRKRTFFLLWGCFLACVCEFGGGVVGFTGCRSCHHAGASGFERNASMNL